MPFFRSSRLFPSFAFQILLRETPTRYKIEQALFLAFMISQSRLALFCEKFIQAGWLVALVVAPLFFNIYSSRVFEPDKIVLIRTLALAMGAAWLILRAERWRGRTASRADATRTSLGQRVLAWGKQVSANNPLTIPALLLLLAYCISTFLSVSPTVSLFGSYQRLQGLYSFSSYLVIFFLAASLIQTRADVARAISLALVASFVIAFYGIIQHYFLDPLPWVGDVTTRVASNLGNSIFIGAYLILTIPLALARLLSSSERAVEKFTTARSRTYYYLAAFAAILVIAAAWGLSFDLGAKNLIEANYTGTLTPDQLRAAASAFNLALVISILVVALWWGAAFFLKQRPAGFLLTVAYAALLALEVDALVFSQSRGPLLGLLGGLFTFGILFALVRHARKLAIGAVSAATLVLVLLALINIPSSPLASLRELPYVGRLGRVFELEGGTGRVRVLIWQGALRLVSPHSPLWSPTTGDDPFNPIRPLIGYGPETMYVAYNQFYPPELGTIESRNATPDRSHNETFDALVTTGLFGFVAENVLFLLVFYFALKWLGFMPSPRARNAFIAAWYGGGVLLAIVFGLALGWEFIGVALPGGMMLGLFAYLVVFAWRRGESIGIPNSSALWFVALVSLFVAHFIEIHFGIAIVSTRVYFWFFAAVFIALGTKRITMDDVADLETIVAASPAPSLTNTTGETASARARRKRNRAEVQAPLKPTPRVRRVSTGPLITFAFLVGFILAVMSYDYINTNNLSALGNGAVSGLDIIRSALTIKNTTAGGMTSWAMLWLFITTLLMGLAIGVCEWGRTFQLAVRDWGIAVLLFVILAFAIFSGLVFYHILLIATPGAAILDALLAAVVLFTVFMLIVVIIIAITMLLDEPLPALWVSRATNWVVVPVLLVVAAVLILSTNVDPVRADMLYKQALSLSGDQTGSALNLYKSALALQPQQDYYLLFLGRAYLDDAKAATDAAKRAEDLTNAEQALLRARDINPYNTDHSANLARLAQARGNLDSDPAAQIQDYKAAAEYFQQATRLSPNTVHLYDQYAQSLLDYANVLEQNKDLEDAAKARSQASEEIAHSRQLDPTFCLTYAVRAISQTNWRDRTNDALEAIRRAPQCGDVFISEGLSIAVNELAQAGNEAVAANESAAFEQTLTNAAQENPSLEVYTTLANFYSKAGRVPEAIQAIDGALAHIPPSDAATLKRYQDFRFTLVQLQNALNAAQASPNDPEAQRAVAQQWLARGQLDFALPAFERVVQLKPDDYTAQRNVALILIATDQLPRASQAITQLQPIAPSSDQVFWQRLGSILNNIQNGNANEALTQLDELAKNANLQDYALTRALQKLAEKLKATG